MFINRLFCLFLLSIALLFTGCSKYQKTLKNPDVNKKLEMAMAYYNKKDYYRASTLFEQLQDNFNGTAMAEKVIYYSAYCNYGLRNYLLAGFQFKSYFENFPSGEFAEESLYMTAYCAYLESQDYFLDPTDTRKGIEAVKLFVSVYPDSKYVAECNVLLDKLRAKLAFKAYKSAKLYYDIREYKSAIVAMPNVVREFPEIAQKEELDYLTVKSHFYLAEGSIETKKVERYQNTLTAYADFTAEYPESKYLNELRNIVAKTNTALQKIEKQKERETFYKQREEF
ncbi:MAG: outer membrane protein assembly factor BamD [Bacteroidia bacterium]|jgi:outer membrane protein assembly factor BamD|nr:outer membrane protein assembly factor BamD [Bacteroidia bacterium]